MLSLYLLLCQLDKDSLLLIPPKDRDGDKHYIKNWPCFYYLNCLGLSMIHGPCHNLMKSFLRYRDRSFYQYQS